MHRTLDVCVTCGKQSPEPWTVSTVWDGEEYRFCSEKCREDFLLDPEEYLHDDEEDAE